MHLKALTATLVAVFASGLIGTAHTKALSQTTSNIKQTSTVKEASTAVAQPAQVTVVSGDTLSSIATQNGTTYIRLFDANSGIANPDKIQPGEVVAIPATNAQLPDRYGQFEAALAAANTSSQPVAPPTVSQPAVAPTPTTSAPVSTPVVAAVTSAAPASSVWSELAACESGGNWSIDTGNGFYGGLQFTLSSWRAMGGTGLPNGASEAEQIALAQKLQSVQGWGAWPVCSAKLGL